MRQVRPEGFEPSTLVPKTDALSSCATDAWCWVEFLALHLWWPYSPDVNYSNCSVFRFENEEGRERTGANFVVRISVGNSEPSVLLPIFVRHRHTVPINDLFDNVLVTAKSTNTLHTKTAALFQEGSR